MFDSANIDAAASFETTRSGLRLCVLRKPCGLAGQGPQPRLHAADDAVVGGGADACGDACALAKPLTLHKSERKSTSPTCTRPTTRSLTAELTPAATPALPPAAPPKNSCSAASCADVAGMATWGAVGGTPNKGADMHALTHLRCAPCARTDSRAVVQQVQHIDQCHTQEYTLLMQNEWGQCTIAHDFSADKQAALLTQAVSTNRWGGSGYLLQQRACAVRPKLGGDGLPLPAEVLEHQAERVTVGRAHQRQAVVARSHRLGRAVAQVQHHVQQLLRAQHT